MPSKKPQKEGKKPSEQVELYPLNPVEYLSEDFRTSIELLTTQNEEIKLRAIGRLHQCLEENEEISDYILKNRLQSKFLISLKTENVYILRFSVAVWKIFTGKSQCWVNFKEGDVYTLCDLIRKIFLESEDLMLKNSSIQVILNILQNTTKNKDFFGSVEVISRLFLFIKTTDLLEVQEKCLKIFYYLLESNSIENFLLKTPNFSFDILLCFLQEHPMKLQTILIVNKIVNWDNSEYLKVLREKKMMEIATNLILENNPQYKSISYEILYKILKEKDSDIYYTKTLEFLKFLEFARNSTLKNQSISLNIINKLTMNDTLHQLLFDFGIVDVLVNVFKNYQENTLGNLFASLKNLMRHWNMCLKLANEDILNGLINIMSDRKVSIIPYGELALNTLERFFKCNLKSVEIVGKSKEFDKLIKTFYFYSSSKELTDNGLEKFLEIIQMIVKSKFVNKLLNIDFYKRIMNLFGYLRGFLFRAVLRIVRDLLYFEEFRTFFYENYGVEITFRCLNAENYWELYGVLKLVRFLIQFTRFGCLFFDYGLIGRLLELNEFLKPRTYLCESVLRTFFDLCLSIKFFYTSSLSVSDKIRDQFYLMPEELLKSNKPLNQANKVDVLSYDFPIYVVLFESILKFQAFKLKLLKNQRKSLKNQGVNHGINQGINQGMNQMYEESSSSHFSQKVLPSALAIKFAEQIYKNLMRKESDDHFLMMEHRKKCEDEKLCLYIREIYEEINLGQALNLRKEEKIGFIAKYVARNLNDFNRDERSYKSKRHATRMHVLHLKDVLKSNFVPIGYLRKGLVRERALLFKVICDQVDIPVTLKRDRRGVIFNSVVFIQSSPKNGLEPVISVEFLVDLMGNVGELIPVKTSYAEKYFEDFKEY